MSVKKINETTYEVEIIKSGDEFKHLKEHVLTHFKNAKVNGFRPGKVPAAIIEKTYKNEMNDQILNHILPEAYRNAVEENNLRPIADIKLDKFEITEEQAHIVFTIPVLPEIKVDNYKGVKVEKETVEITDEKVNEELETIRANAGKLKETDSDEAAALNDVVNIDFEGFMDGVAFDGGKAEGFDLTLGSKSFIDNFEDQIVGHKANDEFEVNVSFPENYGAENLAGKPALFKVKVNSIKRKEEATLDDELAKENGYESLDDMREKTKENITNRENARVASEYEAKLIEAVVEANSFEVPVELVNREIQFQINRFEQQMQMQGINLQQFMQMTGQTIEQFSETMREGAEKSVKTDLILNEISKVENITATNEEVEQEIEKMSAMYGMKKDALIEDTKKSGNYDNLIANTEYQIINKKTVDFLVENAK